MRISTRSLVVFVAVVGFDAAAMARAVQQGQKAHDVTAYATGFGLVLLLFNLVILGLATHFARRANVPIGSRLLATPSPMIIVGLYLAVLTLAILSVLFVSSRLF